MMKKALIGVTLLAVLSVCVGLSVAQRIVILENLPPVVTKTYPVSGMMDVDPRIKQIRVSFSKEMADKSWSWGSLSDDTRPKSTGDLYYEKDKRTVVCPVELEAGKDYTVWINTNKFTNFKDTKGVPALPYLLYFRTKK